ncbi:hypothetical protein H4684_002631 [Desulfomicrobium macestii]|uniref:Uncharacterized protein n=1 Tax=Desulfomicrobium macestii TaxID=90731 RepID=A0ABR9H637_9BACT|nr:hypothetical protein [Desulfomicrobium macestii]MBE1425972.1 hypothetical protein [Desulfomicrobium macestii]
MKETTILLAVLMLLAISPIEAGSASQKAMEAFEDVCLRTDEYGCYVNHKYGYALAWPKRLLGPLGESDAGDGQIFASPDGLAELRCWGSMNDAPQQTVSAAMAQALAAPEQQVTYKHLGKDFFVLSGYADGRIFYRRSIMAHGTQATFELTYETSLKKVFDPVIRDISTGFIIDPAFALR